MIFLCYWMIRLKKEILISLLVILLGWNHLNNLLPLSTNYKEIPEEADPESAFRVLSYNVRAFDRYHWTDDPDTRTGIFNFIESQDPDILCFQEYYTHSSNGRRQADLARHLNQLPESAVYFSSGPSSLQGFGIATYSKFPIVKFSRIPFNSSFNGGMYTDILMGQDTIRVFNVHLESIKLREENYAFIDTVKLKYNSEQFQEIRSIGARLKTAFTMRAEQATMISNYIKDSPFPVIVMGDFNDTPQSYAYRKIRKGLHDAFRKAGRGFGNTYAGELPSFRIDHIIYSDPMIPHQFKRTKAEHSDHFPISTWFYLPKTVIPE